MAINQVYIPQRENNLGKISGLAQAAGPLIALIPGGQLAGAAITAGGTVGGMLSSGNNTTAPVQQLDMTSSMRRRQNQTDPNATISEALSALDAMGLPDDKYQQYKAPLYAAMNKSRSMT